jgi:hypothetical protein
MMLPGSGPMSQTVYNDLKAALTDPTKEKEAAARIKALDVLFERSKEPAPTQGFNSVHLLNAAYNRYADIKAEFRETSGQLPTSRLMEMRQEIKTTLTQLSAMREDGLYNQGIGHPFRMLSSEMIRLYGGIEMMIATNVRQMLGQAMKDQRDELEAAIKAYEEARAAGTADIKSLTAAQDAARKKNERVREVAAQILAQLVDETNERIVLDFVRKTITAFQLTLPVRPWKDVFKGLVHLFVS